MCNNYDVRYDVREFVLMYMYVNLCRETTPIATPLRLATWLVTPGQADLQ